MNKALTLALILLTFSACSKGSKAKKMASPAGYDLNTPVKYKMTKDLFEISGIAFYPGKKDRIYAIQDEDGKLFWWPNGSPEQTTHLKFGKHGDYEDISILNKYVLILRSDGNFFIFPYEEIVKGSLNSVKEWSDLVPEGEYEGMYADSDNDDVYVLCKSCGADKEGTGLSGYMLHVDAGGSLTLKSNFRISVQEVAKLAPGFKGRLKPSALTYNKQNNEWYILSSVNKMLIIADRTWKPKQVFTLNPSLFPQPEGISFDIDNNLYISNEAGTTSAGTVLKFPYNKAGG